MNRERWQQIKSLLDACADMEPEQRAVWLDEACADLALRREVEAYLVYEDDLETFDAPATQPLVAALVAEGEQETGRLVGPYRLEELLGCGGMGAVYRASREEEFEQRVALKLMRSGFKTPEMVERFHTERQILARLEHPNIARLLDGGTSDGLPFFVMELIDGVPIDRYCDDHRLSVQERLRLILQICDALIFAHRNLVLHLDLKPGNILVTDDGIPKLLDFGIGKLLAGAHQAADDDGDNEGPRRMTVNYASPEQLLGEPMATSSDLYSLGVVLYELLTGRLPCGPYAESLTSLMWAICHDPPRLPSAVVARPDTVGFGNRLTELQPTTVAGTREGSARKLCRRIRGDLDAILLRTLEKDPAHRYASVEQLGLDIRRHLRDLPVQARGSQFSYRATKFARRNRWALGVGTAVLALILSFTAALSIQLGQTERQRQRSALLSEFLVGLFRAAEPGQAGEQPSVRELVDIGRGRLESALEDEPEARAQLLGTLGQVYYRLGFYEESTEAQEKALGILRRMTSEDHPDIAKIMNDLSVVSYTRGRYDLAEDFSRASISMRHRLGEGEHTVKPRNTLAAILMLRGKLDEAAKIYGENLERRRQKLGDRHPNVAVSLRNLANVHLMAGRLDEAESLLLESLDIRAEASGRNSASAATVLASLGRVVHARGDLEAAEIYFTEALEIRRETLGDDHLNVALLRGELARLMLDLGEIETAGVLFSRAFGPVYRHRPEGDWGRADLESAYGAYLAARGRRQEAKICLEGSHQTLLAVRGPDVLPTRDAARRLEQLRKNTFENDQLRDGS